MRARLKPYGATLTRLVSQYVISKGNANKLLLLSRKVSFYVGAVEGPEKGVQITVEEAWAIPQLNLPPQRGTRTVMQDFSHLTDFEIHEVDSEDGQFY